MDEALIDEAYAACHAYAANMTSLGHRNRLDPDKHMKHWHAIARCARRYQVTPEQLVSARFAAIEDPKLKRMLRPSQIYRPAGAVAAALNGTPRRTDIEKVSAAAAGLLRSLTQRRPDTPVTELLEDPNYAFPAWFRVLRADELTPLIEACYLDDARLEYEINQDLRDLIAEKYNGFNVKRLT